jgi:hypothetical protein
MPTLGCVANQSSVPAPPGQSCVAIGLVRSERSRSRKRSSERCLAAARKVRSRRQSRDARDEQTRFPRPSRRFRGRPIGRCRITPGGATPVSLLFLDLSRRLRSNRRTAGLTDGRLSYGRAGWAAPGPDSYVPIPRQTSAFVVCPLHGRWSYRDGKCGLTVQARGVPRAAMAAGGRRSQILNFLVAVLGCAPFALSTLTMKV